MESMTIACTRCGATQDGDIILPPIAFTFKHNLGCGHGVGPLAVLPGTAKKKPKTETSEFKKVEGKSDKHVIFDEVKEIKVEEKVKESKPLKEKIKVFGKKD